MQGHFKTARPIFGSGGHFLYMRASGRALRAPARALRAPARALASARTRKNSAHSRYKEARGAFLTQGRLPCVSDSGARTQGSARRVPGRGSRAPGQGRLFDVLQKAVFRSPKSPLKVRCKSPISPLNFAPKGRIFGENGPQIVRFFAVCCGLLRSRAHNVLLIKEFNQFVVYYGIRN